jgi:hypothetical protein
MRLHPTTLLFPALPLIVACSDATPAPGSDTTPDTVVAADVAPDIADDTTGPADVPAIDTAPADTSGEDSATPDIPATDTAAPDTHDTGPEDLASHDADSESSDVGADVDTAPPTPLSWQTPVRSPAHPTGLSLSVTFNVPIDADTLTVDPDTSCAGAIQLSADDFATCVPMLGAPSPHPTEPLRFDLRTATLPPSGATLRLRVGPDIRSEAGTAMGFVWQSPPVTAPYHHTIAIDGRNDFLAEERLTTTTSGHTAWLAWDATSLYLGMESPDLDGDDPETWFVAYLGVPGLTGTSEGVLYNTQQPALPFDAFLHVRWKASDDFGGALQFEADAWTAFDLGLSPGAGNVAVSGSYVELRIPLSALGDPTTLYLHTAMLREEAFAEATWAGAPAGSLTDGYDPDVNAYLEASLFYRNLNVVD